MKENDYFEEWYESFRVEGMTPLSELTEEQRTFLKKSLPYQSYVLHRECRNLKQAILNLFKRKR